MPTKSATPYGWKYGVTDAQAVPTTAEGSAASQQQVRDPVCGMEISPREAAASAEVDQKRYWFCSPHCERAFLANPAKYIANSVDKRSSAGHSSSAEEVHQWTGLHRIRLGS
jgi:Cu+-exporting ATPase